MERTIYTSSVTIQIPNPIMPPNYGLPIISSTVQIITDSGQQVGHPVQIQTPVIQSDLTDELIASLNTQLATVGLVLSRV